MRFEYFRFLLTPIQEPELPFHPPMERKELINEIFSAQKKYHFTSGRAKFGLMVDLVKDGLVLARVGKQTVKNLRASPEEDFAEKKAEDWPGSIIIINLDDEHETGRVLQAGQVIAFSENKVAIPNPEACLQALAGKINNDIRYKGFFLSIRPILKERKRFWAVAETYKGQIRKVVLEYTPPNVLKLGTSLEEDLRKDNEVLNTTKTQVVFENDAGHLLLPKDNDFLKQSAEYIDNGAGSFKFTLKNGKTKISSQDGVRKEEFSGIEISLDAKNSTEAVSAMRQIIGISDAKST